MRAYDLVVATSTRAGAGICRPEAPDAWVTGKSQLWGLMLMGIFLGGIVIALYRCSGLRRRKVMSDAGIQTGELGLKPDAPLRETIRARLSPSE